MTPAFNQEVREGDVRNFCLFHREFKTALVKKKTTVVSAFAAIEMKTADCRRQTAAETIELRSIKNSAAVCNLPSAVFFGKTDECLDIYHALEYVAACGKALYGSGQTFKDWYERMRLVLLSEGFTGMDRELSALKDLDADKQKAVESLREYLRKNEERLHYAQRLSAGLSIG
jgi:hypothetical protein